MITKLITYATPNFYFSKYTLIHSAKRYGIKNVQAFSDKDFEKTDFYKQNINITSQPRGAGYWLWKPYYIYENLLSLNEDDILIYCDSGVDLMAPLDPLFEIFNKSKDGILLFENYQGSAYFPRTSSLEVNEYNLYTGVNKNKYWAKRDVFVLMGLDKETYWNSPQVNANFQIYKKTKASLSFVKEWLDYCCNEQILTDSPNISGLPNFENLFAHIHDQAIISLLAEKYNIELYRCPSQFGNHYKTQDFRMKNEFLLLPYNKLPKSNSLYGTLTNHHRTRFMPFWFRYKSFVKQEIDIFKANWL